MDESEILNTSSRGMYRRRDNRSSIPVSIDVREDSGENKPRRQVVNQMDDKDGKAARLCIRGVWEDPALLLHLKQMLPIEYMPDWMREVLNAMSESIAVLGRPQRDDVISRLSESSAEEFSHALVEDINIYYNKVQNEGAAYDAESFGRLYDVYAGIAGVIGIFEGSLEMPAEENAEDGLSAEAIEALIQERLEARKSKNWARADEIRNRLKEQGIILEDSAAGTKWHRA